MLYLNKFVDKKNKNLLETKQKLLIYQEKNIFKLFQ